MKKNFILWIALSSIVMLLLPWLAVNFIKSDAAMAVCFILFYVINPVYSVAIGIFAGKDIKYLFSFPIVSSVLFLVGTWIFFDISEIAFIIYAGIYLILGVMSMLISNHITKKRMYE